MHNAIISGLCASIGSLFGKLSSLPQNEIWFILRILCFGLMLSFNSFAMISYVKSLHSSDSTLSATVVSNTANYIFSALFGFVIFYENTTFLWWMSMAFVITGLGLIVQDQKITENIEKVHQT